MIIINILNSLLWRPYLLFIIRLQTVFFMLFYNINYDQTFPIKFNSIISCTRIFVLSEIDYQFTFFQFFCAYVEHININGKRLCAPPLFYYRTKLYFISLLFFLYYSVLFYCWTGTHVQTPFSYKYTLKKRQFKQVHNNNI